MSTILKALKKLEDERSGTTGQLSGQVACHESDRSETGRPHAALFLAGGLLLGVLMAFGWFSWMKAGPDEVPVAAVSLVSGPVQKSPPPAQELVEKSSADSPEVLAEAVSEPVVTVFQPVYEATLPVVSKDSSSAGRAETVIEATISEPEPVKVVEKVVPPAAVIEVEEVQMLKEEVAAVEPPQFSPLAVPTNLQVSAIFFNQDGDSMAVVDDLPVMEGMMIDDVRVEKIFADKIHFNVDGALLVIPLLTP